MLILLFRRAALFFSFKNSLKDGTLKKENLQSVTMSLMKIRRQVMGKVRTGRESSWEKKRYTLI